MSISASVPMSRIVTCGLLFVFTLLSGMWLSHLGKPFNGMVFTIHKLIAVATVIIIARNVYQLYKVVDVQALVTPGTILITGLLFATLIVTGALLSLKISLPDAIHTIHQVTPWLALAATTMSIYLLASDRS